MSFNLPRLMVAPNGANRTKADHPALPVTLTELVQTAKACAKAGADGLHIHLRDSDGRHVLDAGLYREALAELSLTVPGMALQVTTEANGAYDAAHQRQVALESGAEMISAALREMLQDTSDTDAHMFYETCAARDISVQHILYDAAELDRLHEVLSPDMFMDPRMQILFVLGRYTAGQSSDPTLLTPFLDVLHRLDIAPEWAVCAFGQGETACLTAANAEGGKLRVGFENSLQNADGSIAADNAERVRAVLAAVQQPTVA